ncbi:MAG: PilZ domain-containing protein [Xanthobacteraceae bacterium]
MSAGSSRGGIDLRRVPRRSFHYKARLLTSEKGPPRNCSIMDISQSGARIVLEEDHELPKRFLLLLGSPGAARRICRLVWRDGLTAGVEFPNDETWHP